VAGLIGVALLSTACPIYSQSQGNASAYNWDTVIFAVNGNSSQAISNLYQNTCNYNIDCFINIAGNAVGNSVPVNPFWGDCSVIGQQLCYQDWISALYWREFTEPGGWPTLYWGARCFSFLVNVNIGYGALGVYEAGINEIPGSVNWLNVGNWNCQAT
jgi:hypothetical protein